MSLHINALHSFNISLNLKFNSWLMEIDLMHIAGPGWSDSLFGAISLNFIIPEK